jgi:hypothetical protein
VTPCSLVRHYRRFAGTFCVETCHYSIPNIRAAGSSKTLITIYQTIRRHIPEDGNDVHSYGRKNLKSWMIQLLKMLYTLIPQNSRLSKCDRIKIHFISCNTLAGINVSKILEVINNIYYPVPLERGLSNLYRYNSRSQLCSLLQLDSSKFFYILPFLFAKNMFS